MVDIHKRLQKDNFRFVKVKYKGKKAYEEDWTKTNNYTFNEIISHKGNYGVATGFGNLLVVDFDDKEFQEQIVPHLPKTFSVKTGSGGLHLYYLCNDTKSWKIKDDENNTLADIQSVGRQVVGPGSVHPNGNTYAVIKDLEINLLDIEEFKAIVLTYSSKAIFPDIKNSEYSKVIAENTLTSESNEFLNKIKQKITVTILLKEYGIIVNRNPCECPIHNSKGKKSLSIKNNELWYCFGCGFGGSIFDLVMKKENVSFKKALKKLSTLAGLEEEYDNQEIKIKKSKSTKKTLFDKPIEKSNYEQEKKAVKEEILLTMLSPTRNNKYIATEYVVDFILRWHTIKSTRCSEGRETWIYREGIYIPNGNSYIEEMARYFFDNIYTTNIKNEVLTKIQADTYIDDDDFFNHQVKYPHLLPVKNGVLDLKTKKLQEHSDKYYFFNKINASYDLKADCPKIKNFVRQIVATEKDFKVIQEMFGFSLYKEYFLEKAIMLYGSNGRNGKTKLLTILKDFLGPENVTSVSLQDIEEKDFTLSTMFGKMVNISAEISNNALTHTGNFRALTGRDVITANRKFKEYIYFVNYAKMFFASNELPTIYTMTDAFWLRWIIIDFPYQFIPQKEIDALSDNDKRFARLQNPDILKDLTTDEEFNGLLNWAMEGLDRLFEKKDFSNTDFAENIKNKWLRASSSVLAFCREEIVESCDEYIVKSDFQRKYNEYCKLHKLRIQSTRAIKSILTNEFGVEDARLSFGPEGFDSRPMVWRGITFKNIKNIKVNEESSSAQLSSSVFD